MSKSEQCPYAAEVGLKFRCRLTNKLVKRKSELDCPDDLLESRNKCARLDTNSRLQHTRLEMEAIYNRNLNTSTFGEPMVDVILGEGRKIPKSMSRE
jgi:hypothetical protein